MLVLVLFSKTKHPGLHQQYHMIFKTLTASMIFCTVVWKIVLAVSEQDQASVCATTNNASGASMN